MKCSKCDVDMEVGWLTNNAQNWTKGSPFGKVLSQKLGSGKPVSSFRCPKCGEIRIYTDENIKV